jgi:hypothetical protein
MAMFINNRCNSRAGHQTTSRTDQEDDPTILQPVRQRLNIDPAKFRHGFRVEWQRKLARCPSRVEWPTQPSESLDREHAAFLFSLDILYCTVSARCMELVVVLKHANEGGTSSGSHRKNKRHHFMGSFSLNRVGEYCTVSRCT